MKNFSKFLDEKLCHQQVDEKLVVNKDYINPEVPTKIDDPKSLKGKRIKILKMDDPYSGKEYNGKEGTVEMVDSMGDLHGTWGSLAIIPEIDQIIVLDD